MVFNSLLKKRRSYKEKQYHCVFFHSKWILQSPNWCLEFYSQNRQELPEWNCQITLSLKSAPSKQRNHWVQRKFQLCHYLQILCPFFFSEVALDYNCQQVPLLKQPFLQNTPTLQINILYAQNIFKGITSSVIVSMRYHCTKSKHIH